MLGGDGYSWLVRSTDARDCSTDLILQVEGLLTCVVALPTFWLMPAFPEETKMFDGEEKAVLLERLRQDGGNEPTETMWSHIMEALVDWKIWLA